MRRNFLKTSGLGLAASLSFGTNLTNKQSTHEVEITPNFTSDGIGLSPKSYAKLLLNICEKQDFKTDAYGLGGIIHQFEEKVAKALGKEKAIYMPTGTLANHIALRIHSPRRKKALVQQQSHIYRDSGDALQQLSGMHLLPMAYDAITFDLAAIQKELNNASAEKVHTGIDVISIETPVRRKHLRRFDFEEIKKISHFAKGQGIAMHLDGARIFGEAVCSNIAVKEYANLFDTVYISLYKYFNSIAGAILAGPADLINGLHDERRMFGGGLRSAWENIVVADYFFDGFNERFAKAQQQGKTLLDKLTASGKFHYKAYEDGTNVYQLFSKNIDNEILTKKLQTAGIDFPSFNQKENCFVIKLNESLNHVDMEEMVKVFL